jgi:hypothetical protein
MKSIFLSAVAFGAIFVAAAVHSPAAETNEVPRFQEIYDLLRKNLAEATDTELNRAAVEGLIYKLHPYAAIINPKENAPPPAKPTAVISHTTTYDDHYGYLRVHEVNAQLAQQVRDAVSQLKASNTLSGLVLDLRFATGEDYKAAAQTADMFVAVARPLLKWGDNQEDSTAKTNAFTLPLVVLVNPKTAGAAEALAGVLRQANAALLIGSNTAGRAVVYHDFPLQNGEILRVASTLVRLGDGSIVPITGLKPDIQVPINAADESAYYADAYAVLPKNTTNMAGSLANEIPSLNRPSSTNFLPRHRFNEAELVRMRKEGQNLDELDGSMILPTAVEAAKPTLQDPVLARGLDLLKGLAVVRKAR